MILVLINFFLTFIIIITIHKKDYENDFLTKLENLKQAKAQKRKRVETPSSPPSKTRLLDNQKLALPSKKKEFFQRKPTQLPKNIQDDLYASVINYIIADALPLSTVESIHFREMLSKHNERATMMSVKHA